jgi:patatin-like phospholipase/acyl hydrolase
MFRILSLDGGGIKGAFSASAIAAWEEDTKKSIINYFDLITGTSTGGIIAIGLALGIPASKIRDFYREKGPIIFPSTSLVERTTGSFFQLFTTKYSHSTLRQELTRIFGPKKFGEAKCRLVIPTYDAIGGRIFLLKTAHHERFRYDVDAPAVDVALATSAAPTYFEAAPFPEHQGASYVDGGIWANNPVLVGLIEAVHFLSVPLDQIDILSVGATSEPFNIAQHKDSGILEWNKGLIDLMFKAQMESALSQANLLLNGRVHRVDHIAKPGEFSLDDARAEKIQQLINLGRGEAVKKENLDVVLARFLNNVPATSFVPPHRN